ncbi:MAG: molybdate ABC transporter substrate-binding protein [Planctomycetes bacterium]|nr:molybdate ABC transporter substrate-binding protein [Planctomycetota bacterium]
MTDTSDKELGIGQGGPGRMLFVAVLSVVLVAALSSILLWRSIDSSQTHSLLMYCAVGMRKPVEEIAKSYEKEYGVRVELQFGGSNTLLNQLEVSKIGDLYLAADQSYLDLASEKGLTVEQIELAHIRPVILVKKGNPKSIVTLKDLLRDDVTVVLGDPERAAIGKTTRKLVDDAGLWSQLEAQVRKRGAFMPTVTEAATAVLVGSSADASIVWDATASQYAALEAVRVPELDSGEANITVGIIATSDHPTDALRFARYLTSRDRGLPRFKEHGFRITSGDLWAERPKLTIYSGGVNRLAIDDQIDAFAAREGVEINRLYQGCGLLVSQMKSIREGTRSDLFPDMYISCDASYHDLVSPLFQTPIRATSTDMVILVQPKNPYKIQTLADLTQSGLRVGLANPEESALGGLSRTLLKAEGVYEQVMKNCVVQTPTADLLVNAMKAGGLDAAIVYRVNCTKVKDEMPVIPIDHPKSIAVQTYAIAQETSFPKLSERLFKYLLRAEQQQRFEKLGFRLQ